MQLYIHCNNQLGKESGYLAEEKLALACSKLFTNIQSSISCLVEVLGRHRVSIWNRLIELYRLDAVLKSNIDFLSNDSTKSTLTKCIQIILWRFDIHDNQSNSTLS